MIGPGAREPVEERLADRLNARQADAGRAPGGRPAAPPRQLRPGRLPIGGTAAHAKTGRAAEAGVRLRQLLQAVVPRRRPTRAARRTSGPACRAHRPGGCRRGVPGGEPAHEDGWRTPPPRPGSSRRPPAAMGAHAGVDIVPLRSLRVRRRLRRRRRRRPAGAAAAVAGSSLDRGVLPRIHRRALPQRRTRRGGRRGPTRTTDIDSGTPLPLGWYRGRGAGGRPPYVSPM